MKNVKVLQVFSRGHATLHLAVLVGPLVRPSVGWSVTFPNCMRFLHYCSCPTVRDWIAVYPALLGSKGLHLQSGKPILRLWGGGDVRKTETGENFPMWNHRSSAPPGPLPKKGTNQPTNQPTDQPTESRSKRLRIVVILQISNSLISRTKDKRLCRSFI